MYMNKKKEKVLKKTVCGSFVRDMNAMTVTEVRWLWMRRNDLKTETEAPICAA